MKLISRLVALLGMALFTTIASAQTEPTYKPGLDVTDTNPMPVKPRCWNGTGWAPCPTPTGGGTSDTTAANQTTQIAAEQAIRDRVGALTAPDAGSVNGLLRLIQARTSPQESFQLVAANTPSSAATVFGGNYILTQVCSAYGTLTVQVRNPDGTTFATVLTKTAADAAGGTGMALGSFAVIRVTVTGTTACNAILARVPA